ELKGSKDKIQKITGQPVNALAYPYGNFNDKVVEETKKYYLFGLTTTPELFSEKGKKDELYLLPRIYIKYSTTLDDFAKIVEGGSYTR
ncbi:polysaccharide deacetylase family protein, partial [Peribacillus castrilensis]